MLLPSKDKIVSFDFDKNVVLVHTGHTFNGHPVYDTVPLTAEDKEVICDAWLDWKYRQTR